MKLKYIFLTFSIVLMANACTQNKVSETPTNENIPEQNMMNYDEMMDNNEMIDNEMDSEETLKYTDLSPADTKELIDSNSDLIIIDVSPSYGNGHLPGAVNYYLGDGSLDEAIPNLDKNKTYLVYCHVESVSRAGAQKLIDAGFEKVYRLDGDYPAWEAAGYEIEK
ncbi:hypothetical protein C0583_00430 [Candidatus Parcubacteria bacterium]|nr:MAG: hypothetical protein C0583_00430 [Candidatus Parcubacteria bacterium]